MIVNSYILYGLAKTTGCIHSLKQLPDDRSLIEEVEEEEHTEQDHTEVPIARSVFLDRPGYNRTYTGFIGSLELPPVLPDEKRVCDKRLNIARLYCVQPTVAYQTKDKLCVMQQHSNAVSQMCGF